MIRSALAVAALAAGLCAPLPGTAQEATSLVAVITAPDRQSQLMGMVLGMQAVRQGKAVHVLLCGPAGDLALRDAPDAATAPQPPQGASAQGLMTQLMAAGATVEVCALYLPGEGLGPEALIDGVTSAAPPAMAARLLADGARILSY